MFLLWGLGSKKDLQVSQELNSPFSWIDATVVSWLIESVSLNVSLKSSSEVTSNTAPEGVHLKFCKNEKLRKLVSFGSWGSFGSWWGKILPYVQQAKSVGR